ncbi:hypothetical protein [Carnobacterium funditum]|uniref:hypothetical protein n=1 Tax=Carnobacterium funditum TaxID=2752 RepID=UPI000AD2C518|nr:hypothetical protein [Carnobacterium funditum]
MTDRPLFFKKRACSIIGLDKTLPGKPTNAVGIAVFKFKVIIVETKKVEIMISCVPIKTSANDTGKRTGVSFVPGINSIKGHNKKTNQEARTI